MEILKKISIILSYYLLRKCHVIQIKKLICCVASERWWLPGPVWIESTSWRFFHHSSKTPAVTYPSVGVVLINSLSYLFCLVFFFIPFSWFILLWLQQGWEQNYFCRENTEKWRDAMGSVLWPVLRPDEWCVKIRELFCNGREEIFIGFRSACQPQLCGDFFTDAKLKQSYEMRPDHPHPLSGLCKPTGSCTNLEPGTLQVGRAATGHLQASLGLWHQGSPGNFSC